MLSQLYSIRVSEQFRRFIRIYLKVTDDRHKAHTAVQQWKMAFLIFVQWLLKPKVHENYDFPLCRHGSNSCGQELRRGKLELPSLIFVPLLNACSVTLLSLMHSVGDLCEKNIMPRSHGKILIRLAAPAKSCPRPCLLLGNVEQRKIEITASHQTAYGIMDECNLFKAILGKRGHGSTLGWQPWRLLRPFLACHCRLWWQPKWLWMGQMQLHQTHLLLCSSSNAMAAKWHQALALFS